MQQIASAFFPSAKVKGMYEDAMKEKENMVLKYAKSEKEVLDLRKAKEAMEKKAKEAQQHVESTNIQMKQIRVELSKMRNTTMSQVRVIAYSIVKSPSII